MDGTFPAAKKGGVSMTKESGEFDQIDQWKSTMFLYSSALKSINTKIEILNNVEEEERRVEEEKRREREKAEKRQEELAGNGPT